MRILAKRRRRGRRGRGVAGSCAGCSGAGTWVRPMPLPGCSGAARRDRCSRFTSVGLRFFSKGISAVPGAEGAPLRCQECAPHFLLSWQKKTCRARYKRKPPFSGLLVRPVKTGLVSSSCAEPLDLSVRSRRSCFIGCKPEGAKRTRGPSCAAAARSGNRSKFLPRRCKSALRLPTERQRRCCGKQSYLHQQVI